MLNEVIRLGLQDTLKALSDPIRRDILNLLKDKRYAAGEIAEKFPVTAAAISRHLSILKENIASVLKSDRANLASTARADVYRWIASYSGAGFTVAFADPPYSLGEEKGYSSVLATLKARGVVRPGGLFVAEMTAVQKAEETPGWELVKDRTYGKTRLTIWRNLL